MLGAAPGSAADVQIRTHVRSRTDILIHGIPILAAMTFEFHRNRYESRRGPSDASVSVMMPKSLRDDLTALSLAYEEPKCSIRSGQRLYQYTTAVPQDSSPRRASIRYSYTHWV